MGRTAHLHLADASRTLCGRLRAHTVPATDSATICADCLRHRDAAALLAGSRYRWLQFQAARREEACHA